MSAYFTYGEEAVAHLKARDKRLGACIDRIGRIRREADSDLFSAVIHQIIGQQISMKALATIWARVQEGLGAVTPGRILQAGREKIQSYGMTHKKASYILDVAAKVEDGRFPLETMARLPDDEVIRRLCSLGGIGVWTAEMILLFGMQRQDVVSFRDLAILRGMRMVYRHREIDRARFERYRKRYRPYGSVASLYLWAVAGGAIEGLTDPNDRRKTRCTTYRTTMPPSGI